MDSSANQYLETVRNFMITLNQELQDAPETPVSQADVDLIDKVSVYLKNNKLALEAIKEEEGRIQEQKRKLASLMSEMTHLDKRLHQKVDEIAILRETVKTLYAEREAIATEKHGISKQLTSIKQTFSALKRKYRRQEDEMSTHKQELNKLTNLAEERLSEYAHSEEEKKFTIKKLHSENEKLKTQLSKKERFFVEADSKLETLKKCQQDYEHSLKTIEKLKFDNRQSNHEIDELKEAMHHDKTKSFAEIESLNQIIQQKSLKITDMTSEIAKIEFSLETEKTQNKKYEEEILIRTQKIKEKSQQLRAYSEEVTKLASRIEDLSYMSDEVINQNRDLQERCRSFQEKIEQYKALYQNFGLLKGKISNTKSKELGILMDSLGRLHHNF